MEWIDQFQQSLGRPVLAFLQAYWMYLLPLAVGCAWWVFDDSDTRKASTSTDLTIADGDCGDGGGGDGGGGD